MLSVKCPLQRQGRGFRTVSDRTPVRAWDMVCSNSGELAGGQMPGALDLVDGQVG